MSDKATSPYMGMMSAYNPKLKLEVDKRIKDNAYFDSWRPNSLFSSPDMLSNPAVFPHEFGHMMSWRAGQRYNVPGDALPTFMFKALKDAGISNPGLTVRSFRDNFNNEEVQSRFKELFPQLKKNNRIAGKERDLEELLVDLNAFETANNIDVTQDPVLLKSLFNDDPKLIEAYRAVRPERSDRLDAKDLPPLETQYQEDPFSMKPSIKAWWKNVFR